MGLWVVCAGFPLDMFVGDVSSSTTGEYMVIFFGLRVGPIGLDSLDFHYEKDCHERHAPENKKNIHPGRLTWNLQIIHLERKMIFQTFIIMFQPLIFRGVPLGPQTTNLWCWLELKHPKFLGCLSWVGNWSNLRNLQRIFWLEGSYPGLNYDSGKDGMKDLIVHHWVGWTMIQFFYKPDDVLLTQLSFGKKLLRNAPGKGEIILHDLGLFPVCFYRFYHPESPLSHHVGNMFLPSTLSESKMNLIACVEMSFCHNTVCTVWCQDFWDGTLQEGCKGGKKPEGWFWSKHNSGRRCCFCSAKE